MARATRRRLGWGLPGPRRRRAARSGSSSSAAGGTPDPTDPSTHLSHLAVVVDSGILVLREGLETILVLAVLTASMRGDNSVYRKPLALGRDGRPGRRGRHLVHRHRGHRRGRPGQPRPPGGHRAAGHRRAAGGHELVLPQGLLDGLDRQPQPPAQGADGRGRLGRRASGRSSALSCWASPRSTARGSRSSSSCRTCACATARASCSRAWCSGWCWSPRSAG